MRKIYLRITLGIIIIAIASILVYFYMIFTEKSPIYYTNEPFPLGIEKTYIPGDTLRFIVNRCADKVTTFTIGQSYIAEDPKAHVKEYYLESVTAEITSVGCTKVLGIPTKILKEMPTGYYHKKHTIAVKGKFRDFVFTLDSAPFKVENPHPDIYEPRLPLPLNTPYSEPAHVTLETIPIIEGVVPKFINLIK